MSERRQWTADDATEVADMVGDGSHFDGEAVKVARHFGCHVVIGIPRGPGYWALEPRCVLGVWYKRPGGDRYECLNCYGISAFDSDIREAFLKMIRASA